MARIAVLERLSEAKSPLSHADLAELLVPIGLDRATVYRNLVDLAEANLVRRAELGDHVWRFELIQAGDAHSTEAHPHFICIDCGQVTCLSGTAFSISPPPGSQGSVIHDLTEVLLKGHCGQCVT